MTALPTSINFSGGTPSKADIAPSVVFLLAFTALIGVWIWRLIQSRSIVLVRIGVFLVLQVAFDITRIMLAKQAPNLGKNLTIVNLVLVLAGTLLLLEPPISVWIRYASVHAEGRGKDNWVVRVGVMIQIVVLGVVGLAAYTGGSISSLLDDPTTDKLNDFKRLRLIGYILAIAVAVTMIGLIAVTHVKYQLDHLRSGYLGGIMCAILVICVYRLVAGEIAAASRSRAAFWVFQVGFGWIVCAFLLCIDLNEWFPSAKALAIARGEADAGLRGNYELERSNGSVSKDEMVTPESGQPWTRTDRRARRAARKGLVARLYEKYS